MRRFIRPVGTIMTATLVFGTAISKSGGTWRVSAQVSNVTNCGIPSGQAEVCVNVMASGPQGTSPTIKTPGLAASDPHLQFEAADASYQDTNVTGTLTCDTNADPNTPGEYSISNCTGLTDPNYTFAFDYNLPSTATPTGSFYVVTPPDPCFTPPTGAASPCPVLIVTVSATAPYGTPTNSDVPPIGPQADWPAGAGVTLSYSTSDSTDQTANVDASGLTCSTTATSSSPVGGGPYPISNCSGLSDPGCPQGTSQFPSTGLCGQPHPGYSVFYDYPHSSYTITPAPLTITASSSTVATPSIPTVTPIYSGLVDGNTAPSIPPSCTSTATTSPGTYVSSCAGASDPNYKISYVPGTVIVTGAAPGSAGLGQSVALSRNGNTALVGAPGFQNGKGEVRVYTRQLNNSSKWNLLTVISGAGAGDHFGWSVALNGNGKRALVGAPDRKVGAQADAGAAELFRRISSPPFWLLIKKLSLGTGARTGDHFGWSVALNNSGKTALVGAPDRKVSVCNTCQLLAHAVHAHNISVAAGTAERFNLSSNTIHDFRLGSGARQGDQFGYSVALNATGDRVLIGAPNRSTPPVGKNGAAYVFNLQPNASWSAPAKLRVASLNHGSDRLGQSVALNGAGDIALLGAPGRNVCISSCTFTNQVTGAGAAETFAFVPTTTSWTWTGELSLSCANAIYGTQQSCDGAQGDQPSAQANDGLGFSVALSDDGKYAVAGAPFHTIGSQPGLQPSDTPHGGSFAGAAEFFRMPEQPTSATRVAPRQISPLPCLWKNTYGCWASELSLGQDAGGDRLGTAGALFANSSLPSPQSTCTPAVRFTALVGAPRRANAGSVDFYTLSQHPAGGSGCFWNMPPEEKTTAAGPPSNLPTSIVQLGDSTSSGEGTLYGYHNDSSAIPLTTFWTGNAQCHDSCGWSGAYPMCHDSPLAYGQLVSNDLRSKANYSNNFLNMACTGAFFKQGIVEPTVSPLERGTPERGPGEFGNWDTRSQLNHAYFEAAPNVVLIGLGANEVHFSTLTKICITRDTIGNYMWEIALGFLIYGLPLGPLGVPFDLLSVVFAGIALAEYQSCLDNGTYRDYVYTQIGTNGAGGCTLINGTCTVFTSTLARLANWVQERAQADYQPRPQVVFTDYPQMVNTTYFCTTHDSFHSEDWMGWSPPFMKQNRLDPTIQGSQRSRQNSEIVVALDNAIGNVKATTTFPPLLAPSRVRIASVENAWSGHEWCTEHPWSYPLSLISFYNEELTHLGLAKLNTQAPFHPTPCGQHIYADTIENVLWPVLGLGTLQNPAQSFFDPASQSVLPGITADQAGCNSSLP
jgi:MBG domain (YGX type)/FG-GAP repeat